MAVFTAESARANVRVRDGKRVFYLAEGDHLTPSARDWLRRDGVEILPARAAKPNGYRTLTGAVYVEKPEHMTHLNSREMVYKTHPCILLRGKLDALFSYFLFKCERRLPGGTAFADSAVGFAAILEFVMIICGSSFPDPHPGPPDDVAKISSK